MEVTVRNLGLIKEADIDLKPLTIFVGPNNAGKTWLAYALSGIFGWYGLAKYIKAYAENRVSPAFPPLESAMKQALDEGNAKLDFVQFADEYSELYFNHVASLAPQWMQEFMGSDLALFDDLNIHVSLGETKDHFLQSALARSLRDELSFGRGRRGALLTMLKESGKKELFMYTAAQGAITEKLPEQGIREFIVGTIFQGLHTLLYERIYVFPTERTTFTAYPPKPGDRAPAETAPQEQSNKGVSWPVAHFLTEIMISLFQSSAAAREREARTNECIAAYIQLAQFLEQHVLRGMVDFSTPEPDPRREILFTSADGKTLEVSIASSMVKELSPLVLYLRYLAQPDEMIVIDEPEMNLHPEGQARLIEFLAMLVNAGIRVLLTTHSPYIVDHLANLMKAAEHTDQESRVALQNNFYLQKAEAFIPKDAVSVFLVDGGTTKSILGEDGIIYWDTFSEVSDKVTQIYFDL